MAGDTTKTARNASATVDNVPFSSFFSFSVLARRPRALPSGALCAERRENNSASYGKHALKRVKCF
jgi:hypothetical protein